MYRIRRYCAIAIEASKNENATDIPEKSKCPGEEESKSRKGRDDVVHRNMRGYIIGLVAAEKKGRQVRRVSFPFQLCTFSVYKGGSVYQAGVGSALA